MTSYKPLMVAHFRGASPRLALLVHGKFGPDSGPDFIFAVTPAKEDQRKLANDPSALARLRDMGSGIFGSRSQP